MTLEIGTCKSAERLTQGLQSQFVFPTLKLFWSQAQGTSPSLPGVEGSGSSAATQATILEPQWLRILQQSSNRSLKTPTSLSQSHTITIGILEFQATEHPPGAQPIFRSLLTCSRSFFSVASSREHSLTPSSCHHRFLLFLPHCTVTVIIDAGLYLFFVIESSNLN